MDWVADSLTRVRNAVQADHTRVTLRHTRLVEQIMDMLQKEGYIRKFQVIAEGAKKEICVYLRFGAQHGNAIHFCRQVSKSSRRVYRGYKELPVVKNGLGTCIVSTSRGVMTAEEARKIRVGGEVLCTVF